MLRLSRLAARKARSALAGRGPAIPLRDHALLAALALVAIAATLRLGSAGDAGAALLGLLAGR